MTGIDGVRRLLLISNSTLYGSGYLDHAEREIRDFVGNPARVLFVPFAVHDLRMYAAKAQERFDDMGFVLTSIHWVWSPSRSVRTILIPTPHPPTWERPRRNELCSSSKRTMSRWLVCGRARFSGCKMEWLR